MSGTIDEGTAWDLLRAVVPGSVGDGSTVRVSLESRDAWLDVRADGSWHSSGETSASARTLLDVFVPIRIAPDIVVGQLGQSLDGRIATESGSSHYVTGRADIERLHRLRAMVDAVIVGASTVAQDDPRLTVRLVEGESPVRVVLDPSGRLEGDRQVFGGPDEPATLVVRGHAGDGARDADEGDPSDDASPKGDAGPRVSTGGGAEELVVPWSGRGELDLHALVEALRARGLRRILVEGGGVTVSRFLAAGLLDRLHVTVAPLLIGSGRPSLTLDPVASLDEALRPKCRRFQLGEDVLFDLDLRSEPR